MTVTEKQKNYKKKINGSTQVKINRIFATLRKDIQLTIFAYFIRLFGRLVLRKGYRENGSEIQFGSYLICVNNGFQERLLVTNCYKGIV